MGRSGWTVVGWSIIAAGLAMLAVVGLQIVTGGSSRGADEPQAPRVGGRGMVPPQDVAYIERTPTGGCAFVSGSGQCLRPETTPVRKVRRQPASYWVEVVSPDGERQRVSVTETEYRACPEGAPWPDCRA